MLHIKPIPLLSPLGVPSPLVGEGQGEGAVSRAPAEHPLFLTFPSAQAVKL